MKVLIVNQVNVFKDIKIYKEKNNKEILVKLYFSDIRFNRTIQKKKDLTEEEFPSYLLAL